MIIRKSKGVTPVQPKTSRVEMDPLHRAIAVQMEADGHTCKAIGERFGRNTSTISEMVKRIKKRAEDEGRSMLDVELYKTNGRRGRNQKLSPHWKQVLVETVVGSHEARKARPEKLMTMLPPDFPVVSTSCLESALYEAHFRRINHLWKSSQEDELMANILSKVDPSLSMPDLGNSGAQLSSTAARPSLQPNNSQEQQQGLSAPQEAARQAAVSQVAAAIVASTPQTDPALDLPQYQPVQPNVPVQNALSLPAQQHTQPSEQSIQAPGVAQDGILSSDSATGLATEQFHSY